MGRAGVGWGTSLVHIGGTAEAGLAVEGHRSQALARCRRLLHVVKEGVGVAGLIGVQLPLASREEEKWKGSPCSCFTVAVSGRPCM